MPSSWDDWATGIESYHSAEQSKRQATHRLTNEYKAQLKVADYWANDPSVQHLSRPVRAKALKDALLALDLY